MSLIPSSSGGIASLNSVNGSGIDISNTGGVDYIAASLVAGSGVSLVPSSVDKSITISASQEGGVANIVAANGAGVSVAVQSNTATITSALVAGNNITLTPNSGNNNITISATDSGVTSVSASIGSGITATTSGGNVALATSLSAGTGISLLPSGVTPFITLNNTGVLSVSPASSNNIVITGTAANPVFDVHPTLLVTNVTASGSVNATQLNTISPATSINVNSDLDMPAYILTCGSISGPHTQGDYLNISSDNLYLKTETGALNQLAFQTTISNNAVTNIDMFIGNNTTSNTPYLVGSDGNGRLYDTIYNKPPVMEVNSIAPIAVTSSDGVYTISYTGGSGGGVQSVTAADGTISIGGTATTPTIQATGLFTGVVLASEGLIVSDGIEGTAVLPSGTGGQTGLNLLSAVDMESHDFYSGGNMYIANLNGYDGNDLQIQSGVNVNNYIVRNMKNKIIVPPPVNISASPITISASEFYQLNLYNASDSNNYVINLPNSGPSAGDWIMFGYSPNESQTPTYNVVGPNGITIVSFNSILSGVKIVCTGSVGSFLTYMAF